MVFASMIAFGSLAGAAAPEMAPVKIQDRLPDTAGLLPPSRVRLDGYLGGRVARNATNRLLNVDENVLLGGFRKRSGSQEWIGEHVGKFLHAATLAWVYTGDARLREKIDRVAAELIKCQEPDGYLGTYLAKDRWTSWDVWVHKYDLVGLLTYYQYTGNQPALEASRKIGDLLTGTFGPGKRSLIAAGTHVGMAATSVLEPMVLLYRCTGDEKYLEFCKYIVRSYDQEGGPKIITTLKNVGRVDKTANGKAYEMLSNLVGLCELAAVTGDGSYLTPAINAWEDVVANHLYITGSASQGEHFRTPHDLPNTAKANVAETCVTTTWIQLNLALLRLTGEARYGDELERTFYNHLAAAQRPDGAQWCYFTPLEGKKDYGPGTSCCVSSGPRGMALVPQAAYIKYKAGEKDGLAVNLFENSTCTVELDGKTVTIEQQTAFPTRGGATLTVRTAAPAVFRLKVRAPAWAAGTEVQAETLRVAAEPGSHWAEFPMRPWKDGDTIAVRFEVKPRLIIGQYTNKGLAVLAWGPVVLAFDQNRNKELGPAADLSLPEDVEGRVKMVAGRGEPPPFSVPVRLATGQEKTAIFVLFAEAGADGGNFQVWMKRAAAGK